MSNALSPPMPLGLDMDRKTAVVVAPISNRSARDGEIRAQSYHFRCSKNEVIATLGGPVIDGLYHYSSPTQSDRLTEQIVFLLSS